MDKTQFHTVIAQQVKIIYCLMAALGLLVIAALDLYEKHHRFALIAAGFALGLVVHSVYMLMNKSKRAAPYPEWFLVSCLLIFTLFGMHQSTQVAHWTYFVPVYTYFLFPFRLANAVLVVYSVALLFLVLDTFPHESRMQVLFTYSSCYMLSFMYALINERNNSKLTEIINTDPLTQVYNEHQLMVDLNKEVMRADRQRSELLLLGVETPNDWRLLKLDLFEHRLSQLGMALRKALRKYDACYRLNNDNFVVVMPQSASDNADALRKDVYQQLSNSIEELNNLNIVAVQYQSDDDALSVLAKLTEAMNAR